MILDTLITDRTQADVDDDTDKGYYNASDMNRVGAALVYLVAKMTDLGISADIQPKSDYAVGDIRTPVELQRYIDNIKAAHGRFSLGPSAPSPPQTASNLGFEGANDIERILILFNAALDRIPAAYRHSGTFYSGQEGIRV